MIFERVERPAWMGRTSGFELAVKAVVIAVVMFAMVYPFITILATSLANEKETVASGGLIFLWPKEPTLDAYRTILAGSVVSRALGVLDLCLRSKRTGGRLCLHNSRGDVADVVF